MHTTTKIISGIFLTVVLLLFNATTDADCKKLIIGWEPWEPFQMRTQNGIYTGLDLDLVKLVLNDAGCSVEFKKMPWKRMIISIKEGTIDMIAGASRTPERENFSFFSEAYRQETMLMFVRKGEKDLYNFDRLSDIIGTGFKLGTTRGYYYGERFVELKDNPEFSKSLSIIAYDHQLPKMLIHKRISGFLGDSVNVATSLRNENLTREIEAHSMPVYSSNIHVMFSVKRVSPETVAMFNTSLLKLKTTKAYQTIIDKYLK